MKILLINSRSGKTFNRAQGFMLAHSILFSDEVTTSSPSNDLILYYEMLPRLNGEEIFDWAKAFFGPKNEPSKLLDTLRGFDPQANGSFTKKWLFLPKQSDFNVSDELKQQIVDQIGLLLKRNGLMRLFPLLEKDEGITLMPPAERCYDSKRHNHLLQEIIDDTSKTDTFLLLDFAANNHFTFYSYKKAFSQTNETDYMLTFPFLTLPSYDRMTAEELSKLKNDFKTLFYRQNVMLSDFKKYIQQKKFPDELDDLKIYFKSNLLPHLTEIQRNVDRHPIHVKYRSLRLHRPVTCEIVVGSELSLSRYFKAIEVFKLKERRILRNSIASKIGTEHCLAYIRFSAPEMMQRYRVKREVPLRNEINF